MYVGRVQPKGTPHSYALKLISFLDSREMSGLLPVKPGSVLSGTSFPTEQTTDVHVLEGADRGSEIPQ